eukprot:2944276-Pyramimonas_sp.AAC.1
MEIDGFRAFSMPRALQSNGSSVLLRATESAVPELSRDGIAEVAKRVPYSLVVEALCRSDCRRLIRSLQPRRSVHLGSTPF